MQFVQNLYIFWGQIVEFYFSWGNGHPTFLVQNSANFMPRSCPYKLQSFQTSKHKTDQFELIQGRISEQFVQIYNCTSMQVPVFAKKKSI